MKKVILFGAGNFTKTHLSCIEENVDILAICDNNTALHGKLFCGKYQIISPEELEADDTAYEILVSMDNRQKYDEVCAQLNLHGLSCRHVNDALYRICSENNRYFCLDENNRREIEKLHSKKQNLIVITAPAHSNLGDHAQTLCIENILKRQFKDSNLFIYDERQAKKNYYELLYILKQSLKAEDIVFLHSGYRLTDLFMNTEYTVEMMGRLYRDNHMVFLPQTVYFKDRDIQKRMAECVNKNVVIMCRDRISYQNACGMFPDSKVMLIPDMVTSMIGTMEFRTKRKGILLCLRSPEDGESLLSREAQSKFIERLKEISETELADTTIDAAWETIAADRKTYVENEISRFAEYELVITNRYHGTIFSLIANTPVIVMPTKDHKITAGLEWFREAGLDGIYFCEEMGEAMDTAVKALADKRSIKHSDYFYRRYFENMVWS